MMLQPDLPFDPPKPLMAHLAYRERLLCLLKGNLDFHGQKTDTGIHSWHAFPAKFPPRLPHVFIAELTQPGDIVFDPMAGSCTTLVEASVLGRRAVGTDIDPLSLRLALPKLNAARIEKAKIGGHRLVRRVKHILSHEKNLLEKLLKERLDPKTKAFADYWFAPHTQIELIALISEIEKIKNSALRSFFTLVFSAIIITKSGGVSLARDLAHTRPHRVTDKIPNAAVTEFDKRLQRNLKLMTCCPQADAVIMEADSKYLPMKKNSVDLIITSPPYAGNAIDYMRAHKFSLIWMGYSVSSLSHIRRACIGGEAASGVEFLPLPKHADHIVNRVAAQDRKKGKVLHRYYSEMSHSLSEMYRVLKPGCAAVIVAGTSLMRGVNIEIQTCLREIAESHEFEHIHTGVRQIDRDKRMMPARRKGGSNTGIEARMHEEYVIGLIKPGK